MLELIVLGQIPGTHFQITLSWVLFMALAALLYVDFKLHKPSLFARRGATKKSSE